MTNWPNIQEYRNFETKFFDNSEHLNNYCTENEIKVTDKNNYRHCFPEDFGNNPKLNISESKTVRCVIKQDFEEPSWKQEKLDRGDGVTINQEAVRPKIHETAKVNTTAADNIRMQNHLKWKKQKEEEYMQKKEAERLAQQKKKEEELRIEKIKKQKEKERGEKIREWQEQKAREKEEKKKEKEVMKMLENELKEVTPVVDKEKLIEEWVKLKNKQKQIEAEKKAELLKKQEESKALRQNLAELSYRQWKERVKGRMMTLPKNGYQIFGPKPVPVVKEDWNNDFTSNSPRHHNINLKNSKSSITSLSIRPPGVKPFDDFSKDVFYLGGLKSRTPSLCQLKTTNCEMPLKELQPGTIDSKNNNKRRNKSDYEEITRVFESQDLNKSNANSKTDWKSFTSNQTPDLMYLNLLDGDQNRCLPPSQNKKPLRLNNSEFPDSQILPNKMKIDLYLNSPSGIGKETSCGKITTKKAVKTNNDVKNTGETKKNIGKKVFLNETKQKRKSKEKLPIQRSVDCLQKNIKSLKSNLSLSAKKSAESEMFTGKICRRSRSYDKPVKKLYKDRENSKVCLSSRPAGKVGGDTSKVKEKDNSKTHVSRRRKCRYPSKPSTPDPVVPKCDKKKSEPEVKTKKKLKTRNFLSQSLSFSDSPYCVKKTTSKILSKGKMSGRKPRKDSESKSEGPRRRRKLSATKI